MEDSIDKLKIEIEASADKAQSSIDVLIEKVEALQGVFKKDMGVKKLMSGLQDLANFQGKIKDIGKDILPASSMEGLNKQIQGLENSFNRLAIQEENFKLLGKDVNSDSYKKLQIEIARTLNGLETLYQAQERMQAESEQLFVGGIPFEQWYEAKYGAQEAEQAITEAVAQIQSCIGNVDTTPLEGLSQSMQNVAQTSAATAESIETLSNSSSLGSIGEKLRSLFNGEGFTKLTESVRNFQQQIGIRVNTTQYNDLVTQIEKAEAALQKFLDKQDRMEAIGVSQTSQAWKGLQYDIKVATDRVADLKRDLELLEENGKDTRLLSLSEAFKKMSDSTSGLRSAFKKINGAIASVGNKLRNLAKDTKTTRQGFVKLSDVLNPFSKQITKLSTMLKMMLTRMALRNVISNLGTGIQGLAVYSSDFNAKISELISSCKSLAYGISALASPLLDIFGPALTYIIDLLSTAVSYVNQFLSALTGKAFYTAAQKNATDYAASLDKVSGSAQKAKSLLAGIDDLNILNSNDSSGTSSDTLENMYESLEISQDIKNMAQQIKDLMSDIFNPLKTAWENVGADVMDSWKYAMNNIKDLAKSIGDDLMTVWKQAETENIFEDILSIVSDIGLVAGNLANNFRLAWEENETGLHILENCRDILAVVVGNIKEAADATVIWSGNLDFSPLLEKIEGWTSSLIPVFDFLSGTISDFYTEVLLPLGTWTLEEGLPDLLQVFIDFNNEVNWEELKTNLQTFWEHLEPFAETVGEGLIIFIGDLSDALANFVNSEAFQNFLTSVEEWMDSVSPDDVADGLKKICAAIIGFKAVETAVTGLTAAKAFINIWKVGKGAEVAAEMGEVATGIETLSTALVNMTAITATGAFISDLNELLNPNSQLNRNKTISNLATELMELSQQLGVADKYTKNFSDSQTDLNIQYQSGKISTSEYKDQLKELYKKTAALPQVWEDATKGIELTDDQMQALTGTLGMTKNEIQNLYDSVGTSSSNIAKTLDENGNVIEIDLTKHANNIDLQIDKTTGNVTTNVQDANKTVLDDTKTTYDNVFKVIDDNGDEITVSLDGNTKNWIGDFDDLNKSAIDATSDIATNTSTDMKSVYDSISGNMDDSKNAVDDAVKKMKGFFDFDWSLPDLKLPHFSISGSFNLNPPSVPSFGVEWYKNGGFLPNSYTLFGAGENGIPEMLGTVGGKSAVASGAEITGIRDAIIDVGKALAGLMTSGLCQQIQSITSIVSDLKPIMDNMQQYMVAGFNDGLEKASASTSDVMQDWISSFSDMTVNIGVDLDVDDSPLNRLGRKGINANMSIEEMADYLNSNLINGNDNYEQMNLMREQNELLQQILDKDISVSGDEVFKVVRKKANEYYRTHREAAFNI
jgi:hypothetical protein